MTNPSRSKRSTRPKRPQRAAVVWRGMNVLGYGRLSENTDGTHDSVSRQRRVLIGTADYHYVNMIDYLYDDNLSAWHEDVKRPDWKKLIAALEAGHHNGQEIHGVLCCFSDRLARNGTDSERFLKVMKDRGLPLITPNGVQELGTDSDAQYVFRVTAAGSIKYSDDISAKTRLQKDDARHAGDLRAVFGWPPPYGFRERSDGTGWEVDPSARRVLRKAAKAIIARKPYHQIAQRAGVKDSVISAALVRPATAGFMTDRDGNVMDTEREDGLHDAGVVIDSTTQDDVLAVQATRRRGRPQTEAYPFSKLLQCSQCGNQLTGTTEKGMQRYTCGNPHPKLGVDKPCRKISIAIEPLHEWFRSAVELWMTKDPDAAAAFVEQVDYSDQRAQLKAELKSSQTTFGDLEDKRIEGDLTDEKCAELQAKVSRKIATIRAQLRALAEVEATDKPKTLDWDAPEMKGEHKAAMLKAAYRTPIKILPGYWGNGEGRRSIEERAPLKPLPKKR